MNEKVNTKMGIVKEIYTKLQENIEWFELNDSGYRKINGGDAEAKITEIETFDKHYVVHADVTLRHMASGDGEVSTTYNGCHYAMDKEGLHILNQKECEEYGIESEDN